MTPKAEELKACPFCGGKPRVVKYHNPHWPDKYAVLCEYTGDDQGCGAEGQRNKIELLAIEAWNTRHTPELEELRKDKVRLDFAIIFTNKFLQLMEFRARGGFVEQELKNGRQAIDAAMKQ